MEDKSGHRDFWILQITSSGSKVMIQFMMFLVVGIIPLLFPEKIHIENRSTIFFIVSLALVTSIIFEITRQYFISKRKDTNLLLNIQLLTSVILLTPFLHLFGRINGPFFVLYLLTVMESFLNLNYVFSYLVVGIMLISTSIEFIWLVLIGEVALGFITVVGFVVRVLSLIFISAYGFVLARKTLSEEKARNQMQEYAERLKELDKQKDEFISVAAHELRTPLTAIKGYISMLLDGDVGKLSDDVGGVLNRTSLAVGRMIRLINNLLDVGRIEEGRIIYRMGYLKLSGVVETVYDEFREEAKMRGIKLTLDIQKDIKDWVYVDSDRIYEVVGNLMTNAFKYTEEGSVKMKADNKDKGFVRVEVKDTGLGIAKDDQKNLFQKYYRSKSSAGKIEGTGLGLYVTRLLVEKFGGRVGVFSQVGKGSTFWFELPLAEDAEENKRRESQMA